MIKKLFILVAVFLFFGANIQNALALEEIVVTKTTTNIYKQTELVQVADNVVILFDSSSSMKDVYGNSGMTKLQAAKKLLRQRTERFPDVFPGLNVGLYLYTQPGLKGYKTYYKMQAFNKKAFIEAVDQLPEKASGPTMLQNALVSLDKLLGTLSGHTVVFLFNDGTYSHFSFGKNKPIVLAQKLAKKYDVSFNIISSTDSKTNIKMMNAVKSINQSSRVYPFELLMGYPELYTGAIFVINKNLIITSSSKDDVFGFMLDHILFDYNKSDIKIEFTEELQAVGKVLQENPNSYLVLAGFTDSMGSEEYNIGLSHRRVEAVGNYLIKKLNIDENRVVVFWYGEEAPIEDNSTKEGRKKNRRVVGFIGGVN